MKITIQKSNKITAVLMALIMTSLILTGCQNSHTSSVSRSGFYLNTVITITLYDTDNNDLLNQGMQLCKRYDNMLSKTDKGSEIYAINHSNGKPTVVSDETLYLIKKGIEYSKKTDGLFNIAIGSVSSLWDFTGETSMIPDDNVLQQTLTTTNYNLIEISGNSVTVPEGMQLDLGGIAKGYIGDKLKEFYIEKGISSALLNLGGNIVCIGTPPDKDSFHIGIKKPFSENETITGVHINDKCVVTSGIYQRYFEKKGIIYHHILDPGTGYPVSTDLYSVTIIADSSMEADILSTTCMLLGLDKAQKFLQNYENIGAIFITDEYQVISDRISYEDD